MMHELKIFGFTFSVGTPTQIMMGMAASKRIHANEQYIFGQAEDGTVYIDENRADDVQGERAQRSHQSR